MENASKALLMAGGMLIAVLIIGIVVYMFTSTSSMFQTEEDIKKIEEIENYNKQYESYNKKLLRGTEVITLMNKVINNNEKYDYEEEYQITVSFELKQELAAYVRKFGFNENGLKEWYTDVEKRNSLKMDTYEIFNENSVAYKTLFDRDITDIETFNDFKRRVFDCRGIEYNKFGRVSKIKFEERKIDYKEEF